ncbi:MAG: FG-GAP repeat protein [Candidatus Thermoplasmatota archaeon]|nr:FG-GAP repeat protein [Candidatus Thermoplasmatota archaeon]
MKLRRFLSHEIPLTPFLVLLLFIPLVYVQSSGGNSLSDDTRTSALDGHYPIADSAYATFVGSGSESPQGKLGEFVGHADVNGDGIEDIVMSAPRLYSLEGEQHAGVCYIWYGNSSLKGGTIDLEKDDPDITIRATSPGTYLLSSISAGDLNDDGFIDMALGMPKQGDSGKVYILWGNETGWDREIILYKAANAEPNGSPIGFLRRDDFAIISGLVTTTVMGTKLGQNVILEDMDGDGSDDLLFSFHGWNKVFAIWGGYPKGSFGTEFTYLQLDPNSTDVPGDFGQTMEVGDINDDGRPDLVIGAPLFSDEQRGVTQSGALFVYYNTSAFRGNQMIGSRTGCRPLIFGQEEYDHLGRGLVIDDIDQDGRDDILAGAPDADGLANDKNQAGQIMVFWGGDISKFPTIAYSEQIYDLMIVGVNSALGERPGDAIGTVFDVGDLDGDSKEELVIGVPGRSVDGIQSVGMVMGYDDSVAFPPRQGIIDLEKAPMKFSLWGSEIEDVTGYSLCLLDANDDGTEDLMVGSPSADGIENLRPGCGEVFLVSGTEISILAPSMTGVAYVKGAVLPGYGYFTIHVPFYHTGGAENIDRVEIVLEKGSVEAHLIWEMGMFSYQGPSIVTLDAEDSSIVRQGTSGGVYFSVSVGWFSDLDRPWDIDISIEDRDSRSAERSFQDILGLNNRVQLGSAYSTTIDGQPTYVGDWQRPGSSLEVKGLELYYADTDGVLVPPGDLGVSLIRNGNLIDSTGYIDERTTLKDMLAGLERSEYVIQPFFDAAAPPDAMGTAPEVSGTISFSMMIDNDVPDAPDDVRLIPEPGRDSIFDPDGTWTVEWNSSLGPEGDHDSSGVKEFRLTNNGEEMGPVIVQGGLWGTYYDLSDLSLFSFHQQDPEVDFDWGHWGPNVQRLTPAAFSVRWHGWLMVDSTRTYRFSLSGNGMGRIILDDEVVLGWGDIESSPRTSQISMEEGVAVPITIYYSNDDLGGGDVSSSVRLDYLDDRGAMSPVPSFMLYFPGNTTEVSSDDTDLIEIAVVAVDWVEHVSSPTWGRGYTDRDHPLIDLSGIEAWYNITTPRIEVIFLDPHTTYGSGSGLDLGSIEYKFMDEFGWGEWVHVKKGIEVLTSGVEGPVEVKVSVSLSLPENGISYIQWSGSDLCGNAIETDPLRIGSDMRGPSLSVISDTVPPSPAGEVRKVICKATDVKGSGVDGDSIQWRTGAGDNWTDWRSAGTSGVDEVIEFEVIPLISAGVNLFQLRGSDMVGNMVVSNIYLFKGVVAEVDRAPTARIDLPKNGTSIWLGTAITLDASSSSDDGMGAFTQLRFTWLSDRDGYLGSGKVLTDVVMDTEGDRRITVFVDDGTPGHNISASIWLEVMERTQVPPGGDGDKDKEQIDILSILLVLVSLVVVSVVLGIMIKSMVSSRGAGSRLDVVERTEDDLDYDESTKDNDILMNGEGEGNRHDTLDTKLDQR